MRVFLCLICNLSFIKRPKLKKMKHLRIFLILSIILQSCIQDDNFNDGQAEKLIFNNSITELTIKNTHTYDTKYTNNIGEVLTPEIKWESDDTTIIDVSNSGELTALSIGETIITATVTISDENGNRTIITEEKIEVIKAKEKLLIDNILEEIIINKTYQYTTTFTNELLEIETPTIAWSSSDATIISVDNTGLITANALGKVTITASVTTTSGVIKFEDEITVTDVAEKININNPISEINKGETHQYTSTYTDPTGDIKNVTVTWTTSDATVLTIDNTGLITAINTGSATITASVNDSSGATISSEDTVTVIGDLEERTGIIATTSSYKLQGGFTLKEIAGTNDLELSINDDYEASTELPGLYLYLTNNKNTNNNAQEIQAVKIFKGTHTYTIKDTGINDFSHLLYWCKPFGIKVGDAEIK